MSLPKQVIKQIREIAQQTAETIAKEPAKIAESVVEQIGINKTKPTQEGKPPNQEITKEELKAKEEQRQFQLRMIRQHLDDLNRPKPEKPADTEAKRLKIVQEAQLKKQKESLSEPVVAPKAGRPKRGSVFLGMQHKKTSEFGGSAATRSR